MRPHVGDHLHGSLFACHFREVNLSELIHSHTILSVCSVQHGTEQCVFIFQVPVITP